jgi:hypothetical protein
VLRRAAHHESSRKIDSTFVLRLFQGSNQFGAIGEPAVVRINCVPARGADFALHQFRNGRIAYYLSAHPQAESG